MTLSGIFRSKHQKRIFITLSLFILGFGISGCLVISWFFEPNPVLNTINSFFVSIVASGTFSIISALYIFLLFKDPYEIEASSILLPKDIGESLKDVARNASEYKIFVRTGRHFREEILPILLKGAIERREKIRIEIVLLDFREDELCKKYASYRKLSSFDGKIWSKDYVREEIMATIIKSINVYMQNRHFIDLNLLLSKRLSNFRIEGSCQEIVVTREDPKDMASRYFRKNHNYSAFANEFEWIRDEAHKVNIDRCGEGELTILMLNEIIDGYSINQDTMDEAVKYIGEGSPYVR